MEMLWPFYVLCGSFILAFSGALSLDVESSTVPFDPDDDSSFIRNVAFMFPENFLSRFPHEADSYRLKIFVYLIFNLLIKGYGSHDPVTIWVNYNQDNYKRALIDAVFYEYLTNYTDRGDKDLLFNPLEDTRSNFSNVVSDEEIAVDRIGQFLDPLSENQSGSEMEKGAYEIVSETNEESTVSVDRATECKGQHFILTVGTPGVDYPNFCVFPKTSFKCARKRIPGVYADYETGCQAFHVCWPSRQDSFLCPVGTIFNQRLLTCDLWHDTRCYSSPEFRRQRNGISIMKDIPNYDGSCQSILTLPLQEHLRFLPSKCEVKDAIEKKVKPKDVIERKVEPKELTVGELEANLEIAYKVIAELLKRLVQVRREMENSESRIRELEKNVKAIPDLNTETLEEATEFTRKRGEAYLKRPKIAEQVSEKPESGIKLGHSVQSSTLLRPSKSLEHISSMKRKDVPEIVTRSLRLGGTILNEGIIPLAKQVMIDSYRKIESKMH